MSRHWRPEGKVVRGPWASPEDYVPAVRRSRRSRGIPVALVVGAMAAGLAGGFGWQWWTTRPLESGPSSPIEWNAVQAVPTRAPDAEDVEWQKRAEGSSPVIASPAEEQGEAIQDTGVSVTNGGAQSETGLPRGVAARNDATGRLYVIDGDTFGIGATHIRILGMDAPETHPSLCMEEARLGLAATQKLKELLGSGTLTMSGSGHDQYGRELRQVSVNGVDVAQTMIAAGLARSYDGGKKLPWC